MEIASFSQKKNAIHTTANTRAMEPGVMDRMGIMRVLVKTQRAPAVLTLLRLQMIQLLDAHKQELENALRSIRVAIGMDRDQNAKT